LKTASNQRGAALIAALLVVALSVTLVAGLLWREQVRIRTLENQRLLDQTRALGLGIFQWSRLILRQDLLSTGAVDHLGEVWAVPIAETPLTRFLSEGGVTLAALDPGHEVWLSGTIEDATARFNLTSLLEVEPPKDDYQWLAAKGINREAVEILARLLLQNGLEPEGALRVAENLQAIHAPLSQNNAGALPPVDLAAALNVIPGLTSVQLEQLSTQLVMLPRPTPVNANTATAPVLAAALGVGLENAQSLIQDRSQHYYADYNSMASRIGQNVSLWSKTSARNLGVASEYFLVTEQIRQDRVSVTQRALVSRRTNTGDSTHILWVKSGFSR
jgi:general secretion pathway protein K